MRTATRKAKITPETIEESRKLRAIWDAKVDKPSQTIFGEKYEIGTQSAVGQFLNGFSPISLKAAKGFAEGLGCKISDFSPRLGALGSNWPFELVDRETYECLTPAQQHKAQYRMQDEIEEMIAKKDALANGTSK